MSTGKTDSYRLKDSKTTFFDPETRLKVVGDQTVDIPKKGRGKLTLDVINAGGLIEVDSKAAKGEAAKTNEETDKAGAGARGGRGAGAAK